MPTFDNILVIHNPVSGTHEPDALTKKMHDYFEEQGIRYEHKKTEQEGDACDWAQEAAEAGDCQLVIAVGGDGTVMEVLRGIILSEKTLPVLIMSMGTANVLARALDMPSDTQDILELLGSGQKTHLDVGYIRNKDRYFTVATGAGYDAEVVGDADRESKRRWGIMAYLAFVIKHIFSRENRKLELELDGKRKTLYAHSVMILNASRLQVGGVHLGPGVDPHDGKLDVLVMRHPSPLMMLRNIRRLLTGAMIEDDALPFEQARDIRITAEPGLPVQADGEVLGETPLDVTVLPDAAVFLVPASYPSSSIFE